MTANFRRWAFATLAIGLIATGVVADDGALTDDLLDDMRSRVVADPAYRQLVNATTNNAIKDLALNREKLSVYDKHFDLKLEGSKVINQRSSGRCWMFAGSNVVAPKVMDKLDLKDFKLSEAYFSFWDKLEKSNHFLEKMIDLADKPLDNRVVMMYLESPIGDGGWWHYFTGLIEKYGVVPASVMPETKQSTRTGTLNRLINRKLRQATGEIRDRHANGARVSALRDYKAEVLDDIYRLLTFSYGVPPTEFTFRWEETVDSTKVLQEERFTPQEFRAAYFGAEMPDYVAVTHNPTMDYDQPYLMERTRNIMETDDPVFLNLGVERLKNYALKSLRDSQLVWFACDVGEDNFNDSGLFVVDIYDYTTAFGIDFDMSKDDMLYYNELVPNHAMVLTAVDTTDDGRPVKWQVENSWGTSRGDGGKWVMSDGWFDAYVLMVIVPRDMLEPEDELALMKPPTPIEEWQPFFQSLTNLEW